MTNIFDGSKLRPSFWWAMIHWRKFAKNVWLTVETVDRGVEDFQVRYINDFLNWSPTIYERLEGCIYSYYLAKCNVEGRAPFVGRKQNIWGWIDPSGITVPRYANGANNYLRFEFSCELEFGGDLEWVIRNGSDILYVGPYEGLSFADLESGKKKGNLNFADQASLLDPAIVQGATLDSQKIETFDSSVLRPIDWSTSIYWEAFSKDVPLRVQPVEIEIEEFQIRYINDFLNWNSSIYSKLEGCIHKYHLAVCKANGRKPFIAMPRDVWNCIAPVGIIVPNYSNGSNNYMTFELNCQWELEHGLEWAIRNGRDILYVGASQGPSLEELENEKTKDEWNFAE